MVRQAYNTNPAQKHLAIYRDFSLGMNTSSSEENLNDRELTYLINQDLGERGSVKRRYGMTRHITVPVPGKGQGYFRFYRAENDYDEIEAVGGRLYKNGVELPITNLAGGFQTTRPIEAVQFGDYLFIATGTKLVEYDGTTAKVVDPYTPTPLEALYIGTNSLAADPFNFMQDGTSTSTSIEGVTFSRRYGVVNEDLTLTAYVNAPATQVNEFMFEYRLTTHPDGFWELAQDWSTAKTFTFKPEYAADYQFRVWVRPQGDAINKFQYIVPKFKVKPAPDPDDTKPWQTIHQCNRIILHWNQLIMYGDPTEPDYIYVSHLNNPRFFPIPNTLSFQNELKEALTTLVQYRDMIVAFTDTSIQALFGKFPSEFRRVTLHKGLGCIAPFGATVMENYVTFLSREGVYVLKSVYGINDRANVERIDTQIENVMPRDEDANMVVEDKQLRIVFPSQNLIWRYYYQYGVWTQDSSSKLDFDRLYSWYGELYGQSATMGHIRKYDPTVWDDEGEIYEDIVETKMYDFGQPYHVKKLKEVQLIMGHFDVDVEAEVTIYADEAAVLSPDESYASLDANNNVVWNTVTTPNLIMDSGTIFGEWEMGVSAFGNIKTQVHKLSVGGRCRKSKVRIVHKTATPNQLLGVAYVFKLKHP